MQSLPPALAAMSAFRQFIVYRIEPDPKRPGRTNKFPIHPSGAYRVDNQDPTQWMDFDSAAGYALQHGDGHGVGFVFTPGVGMFFIDLDHCYDAVSATWSTLAGEICAQFAGCAMEVSSSGDGLHIFGTYAGAEPLHATKPPKDDPHRQAIELYTSGRFVALTGTNLAGDAGVVRDLGPLIARFFLPGAQTDKLDNAWWSDAPAASWVGPDDDDELIRRACASQSAAATFGGADAPASFADLWHGDTDRIQATYGTDGNRPDAALAQHLAFWTGNHAERMYNLMWGSGLVREKWHRTGDDYVKRTIRVACGHQKEFYVERPSQLALDRGTPITEAALVAQARAQSEAAEVFTMPAASIVRGSCVLGADQQIELFKGCVYVSEHHKVMTPDGWMLDQGRVNAFFGGYSFVMDQVNEKLKTEAWKAITESQLVRFPRVRGVCFKPNLPPGCVINDGGRTRVNKYVPVEVPRAAGDAGPFLRHLAKMLPDETDRLKLLSYMAACVQHKGVKFQWAPLLQGVEGNGKTLMGLCVAQAIGSRYVHWPMAADIANNFNAWLMDNIFYCVDEIYIEDKRQDVMETLKPMITAGKGLQITFKGLDQTSQDICGNFMFLTNHRDGVRKKKNDRRLAIFFTAQQALADLKRDGMTDGYFPDLIDWFEGRNAYAGHASGYAVVAELLHTFAIPAEHNPATMPRAPQTSTTAQAIAAGLGMLEQEIIENVEQDMPGFRGGWISSTAVSRVIEASGRKLPQNKYREMLQSLGYDWHPGLPSGRTNVMVTPDNGKPRLFALVDGPLWAMTEPAEIARAYQAAQIS